MGWWWSSSSSPSTESSVPSTPQNVAATSSTLPSTSPLPSAQPLSREEQADKDVESFLASLESNDNSGPKYSRTLPSAQNQTALDQDTTIPAPQETPTHYVPAGTTDPGKPVDLDTLDISPKALYPRTMSCRQAFDQAFYCQSLGGKFNDLYRYGGVRSCSEQWSAFWFCMRVKNLGDNERGAAISEWYEKREERLKQERGGSSEDIWELRTEPVKKAFWKDPDEVTQA